MMSSVWRTPSPVKLRQIGNSRTARSYMPCPGCAGSSIAAEARGFIMLLRKQQAPRRAQNFQIGPQAARVKARAVGAAMQRDRHQRKAEFLVKSPDHQFGADGLHGVELADGIVNAAAIGFQAAQRIGDAVAQPRITGEYLFSEARQARTLAGDDIGAILRNGLDDPRHTLPGT